MSTPASSTVIATLIATLNTMNAANWAKLFPTVDWGWDMTANPPTALPAPPATLQASDCVWGDPIAMGYSAFNTEIPFGIAASSPLLPALGQGRVGVHYNRTDLSKLDNTISVPLGTATKVSDAIAAINTAFGLSLAAADIIDAPIAAPLNVAPLRAAPGSLGYCGSIQIHFV